MSDLHDITATMRAVGEESRLRIVALLAQGELTVKDIGAILEQSQPRVSRHLRILSEAGLVERHAEGAWAYFRLADEGFAGTLAGVLTGALAPDGDLLAADRTRYTEMRARQQIDAVAYFAEVAESWDLLRSLHAPDKEVETAILALVTGTHIDNVLDLGTGTGRMLELLAPLYRRGTGVDTSREMIAVARAKLAAAGITHAQIRLDDLTTLHEGIDAADLVILHQVLHYFDDPGLALRQARKMMNAGATMLIVDFEPHKLEFLREKHAHRRLGLGDGQLTAWARAAGLVVESKRSFPNHQAREGLTVSLWRLVEQDLSSGEDRQ